MSALAAVYRCYTDNFTLQNKQALIAHESVQQLNVQQLYNLILDSSSTVTPDNLKSLSKEESENINYYKVLQLQFKSIKAELQKQQEKNKRGFLRIAALQSFY